MFFDKEKKEIAKLREDLNILATRVQAYAKVVVEILELMRELKEAPHGYKKDGTPKQKPGRKVEA
jgi:hypothetical protein